MVIWSYINIIDYGEDRILRFEDKVEELCYLVNDNNKLINMRKCIYKI